MLLPEKQAAQKPKQKPPEKKPLPKIAMTPLQMQAEKNKEVLKALKDIQDKGVWQDKKTREQAIRTIVKYANISWIYGISLPETKLFNALEKLISTKGFDEKIRKSAIAAAEKIAGNAPHPFRSYAKSLLKPAGQQPTVAPEAAKKEPSWVSRKIGDMEEYLKKKFSKAEAPKPAPEKKAPKKPAAKKQAPKTEAKKEATKPPEAKEGKVLLTLEDLKKYLPKNLSLFAYKSEIEFVLKDPKASLNKFEVKSEGGESITSVAFYSPEQDAMIGILFKGALKKPEDLADSRKLSLLKFID